MNVEENVRRVLSRKDVTYADRLTLNAALDLIARNGEHATFSAAFYDKLQRMFVVFYPPRKSRKKR